MHIPISFSAYLSVMPRHKTPNDERVGCGQDDSETTPRKDFALVPLHSLQCHIVYLVRTMTSMYSWSNLRTCFCGSGGPGLLVFCSRHSLDTCRFYHEVNRIDVIIGVAATCSPLRILGVKEDRFQHQHTPYTQYTIQYRSDVDLETSSTITVEGDHRNSKFNC